MPCSQEDNHRSGIALAMRRRLQWFIHLRAHGLDREMSTPPTLSCGVWHIYLPLSAHVGEICFTLSQVVVSVGYAFMPVHHCWCVDGWCSQGDDATAGHRRGQLHEDRSCTFCTAGCIRPTQQVPSEFHRPRELLLYHVVMCRFLCRFLFVVFGGFFPNNQEGCEWVNVSSGSPGQRAVKCLCVFVFQHN